MTSTNDPYQFSMNDSITGTPRTRSSSRNQKGISTNIENNNKQKVSKAGQQQQQRVTTCSSQKSPITPIHDQNESSFMSNINSGFSQFVNPKKRQRDDKKTKNLKRPRINTYADENQPPDVDNEIQAIEQVKLVYETRGGRTNLTRAAATNAQILANRTASNIRHPIATNTTYIIDETQTDDTLAIPDTMIDTDTQHNDSSWQKDIDRLMRKLEQPASSVVKTPTQMEETQVEDEAIGPIYLTQTDKTHQRQIQTITQNQEQQIQTTTTITQTGEMGIQTESSQIPSSIHVCCQDVSVCPCVLRYSKLERLFMEKMSRFISIVPNPAVMVPENHHHKHRMVQNYSRFRRIRARRRVNQRIVRPTIPNNETTIIEEISDETTTTETDNQQEENNETDQEQNESTAVNVSLNPIESIASRTITIERPPEILNELSSIEKLETTEMIDHPSTLLLSSTNNTMNSYSTGRRLVLTTSSLDENHKSQFRSFISRFGISTSSTVDSSTTHIIVNDNSSLICPLTGKIIQGIARHLFIVSYRWLNECLSQEIIIDERPFEIRGDTSLGSDHGGMRRSRLTPILLLEKYSICLRCSATDCAPLQTIEQVQELIQLCGARLVQNFSDIKTLDKDRQMILVLGLNAFSSGEKKRKAILDTCQQFNVKCLNIHWLLISIAKFELQPFETYDISNVV